MLDFIHFFHTVISFIVIISVMVFVHEFGHYIIAKWSGVKVEIFSIGFGHEIYGITDKSGTRWKLSAIPLGGYVRMYGDASEISNPAADIDNLPEEEKKKTFYHKPLIKKAAIVVAGPMANFLLTIVIFTFFIAMGGLPSTEPVVGEVVDNSPAAQAGIKPGDRIVSIDGESIATFNDIPRIIYTNLGTPIMLKIKRDSQIVNVTLTPKQVQDKDPLGNEYTHPIIGIATTNIKVEDIGLPRAVWEATRRTYYFCTTTLHAIGQIAIGERSFSDNIKGPIGMAKLSGQAADKGISTLFMLMANISASLGLVNLFPIPTLDGGHLLYYAIEAIRGRPLARRFQEYGFRIGMALVSMLMVSAIINDIRKIF